MTSTDFDQMWDGAELDSGIWSAAVAVRYDEQPKTARDDAAEWRAALRVDSRTSETYRRISPSVALEHLVPSR